MKKIIISILVFASIFISTSCEKILMKPNAKNTQVYVFEEYLKIVNEKYGMLEFKQVDINQLGDSLRPLVTNEMTNDSLLGIMNIIVQQLKDGHTNINLLDESNNVINSVAYDFIKDYDKAFDISIMINNYIGKAIAPDIKVLKSDGPQSVRLAYGFLPQSSEIAYMWIPSFDVEITNDEIETVFESFKSAKGLIVDVRQNTGGDPILATNFASYLTDKTIYTGYENFKTGPGSNEFVRSTSYLKPASSSNKFLKPVVVCTDRFVYSAALTFCYSVNPLPHVKFVGQRIGGGSGSVGSGYLSNGWNWNMSISEFIGVDKQGNEMHLDNGFEPDIAVALDTLDLTKDEILERALFELQ